MNYTTISINKNNKTHSILHETMTTIRYFWLKPKFYLEKVPLIANNALV